MPRRKISPKKRLKLKIRQRRPLHKKILLHPIAIFILLCLGVLLVGITYKSYAASISISAKISAPLPTEPAEVKVVIPGPDSVTDQTPVDTHTSNPPVVHVTSSEVILQGSCPEASYVEIFRNDVFAGVTLCIGDPTFSITVALLPGANTLEAQVYNVTDDAGPSLSPIIIYYDQPVNNQKSPSENTTSITSTTSQQPQKNSNVKPFTITTNYSYKSIYVGSTYSIKFSINGGLPPYGFNIDWGDGEQATLVRNSDATFSASHDYKRTISGASVKYTIRIRAADSSGQTTLLQLQVLVKNKLTGPVAATTNGSGTNRFTNFLRGTKRWLLVVWPAYLILLLMTISFWLGEKEELFILRRRKTAYRRRT